MEWSCVTSSNSELLKYNLLLNMSCIYIFFRSLISKSLVKYKNKWFILLITAESYVSGIGPCICNWIKIWRHLFKKLLFSITYHYMMLNKIIYFLHLHFLASMLIAVPVVYMQTAEICHSKQNIPAKETLGLVYPQDTFELYLNTQCFFNKMLKDVLSPTWFIFR